MNDLKDDAALDLTLRKVLQDADEPDDAGFSLRVMAALPTGVPPHQLRWARWVTRAQWLAISLASYGVATLSAGTGGRPDLPHAVAAAALMALLIYWVIPSRWTRA